MIIFESILTSVIFIFRGRWGSRENRLELEIKPLVNLVAVFVLVVL